ncbi:MAG: hypothetical protein AAGE52_14380 [Myxococcota bacterium]
MRALVLVLALASTRVAAQEICHPGGPYLQVALEGEWNEGQRGAIVAELRAALAVQDLDLCLDEAASRRPLAMLEIRAEHPTRIQILVRDAITNKRVERDIDVSELAEDTRTLAIAIAADELVRASWAELAMADAPPPAMPPPPQVRSIVERSVAPIADPTPTLPLWIDATVSLERYQGEELHLGGGLGIEMWVHDRVALRLGLGGRTGLRRTGNLGSVRSRALSSSLDLVVSLVGAGQGLQLVALGGGFVGWARFRSEAFEGASAADESGTFAGLRGGVGLRFATRRLRFLSDLFLGAPIVGVRALDGDTRLSGAEGFTIFVRLGIGVRR